MASGTLRIAPLSTPQRERLEVMIDALADAYRKHLRADALGAPEAEQHHLKKRYHSIRSLYELMHRARGLRKGDTVRMFNGPHAGTTGKVVRYQTGALLLVDWPEDSPLCKLGLPHAWQLELIESSKEEQ